MRKNQRPELVGDILDRLLKNLQIDKKMDEGMALLEWPAVAGKQLAARTRAVSVTRGRMVVETSSSAWANECRMLKLKIIAKLNQKLGHDVIKDIVFRTGDITGPITGGKT